MFEDNVLQKTVAFVIERHNGQFRNDGTTPYVTHPITVAMMCLQKGTDADFAVVALLHDVLEDTDTTEEELREIYPKDIVDDVVALTKDPARKGEYLESLHKENIRVRTVKAADRLHNLRDAKTPHWKKAYLKTTREFLLPMAKGTVFYDELKWECDNE